MISTIEATGELPGQRVGNQADRLRAASLLSGCDPSVTSRRGGDRVRRRITAGRGSSIPRLRQSSPLDPDAGSARRRIDREGANREPPNFDDYRPAPGQPLDGPGELARELADRLRLPLSHRLYVVVL